MRETGQSIGVPIRVFGPETHITAVVPMALGLVDGGSVPEFDQAPSQVSDLEADMSCEVLLPTVATVAPVLQLDQYCTSAAVGADTMELCFLDHHTLCWCAAADAGCFSRYSSSR